MNSSPTGFPRGGEADRDRAAASRSTNPAWWVVAGVAILVSVALIAWLLITSGSLGVEPTGPESSTAASSEVPTVVDPNLPGRDWGDFPPNNVDSLRDLANPVFPTAVDDFTFVKKSGDQYSVLADYEDVQANTGLSASIDFTYSAYRVFVQGILEPAYFDGAVCGADVNGGKAVSCVMGGEDQTLLVVTASEEISVAELAAFTQVLYGKL